MTNPQLSRKEKRTQKEMLLRILKNQQIIYDYLQMIIYNQYSDRKQTFVVKPSTLKLLEEKYDIL